MLTNNNSDVNAEDLVERPRYEYHVDSCAVRKCKWKSHDTNNEGALDLITQGVYSTENQHTLGCVTNIVINLLVG